jgi:XisI protein
MDTLDTYRQCIEKVLCDYAQLPYAYGEVERGVVSDRHGDHYLLLAVGWDGAQRVHGSVVHIDIINGKVWIQRDGTEHGIAEELVATRIPRDHIVLAFRPLDLRQYTGYAVA